MAPYTVKMIFRWLFSILYLFPLFGISIVKGPFKYHMTPGGGGGFAKTSNPGHKGGGGVQDFVTPSCKGSLKGGAGEGAGVILLIF